MCRQGSLRYICFSVVCLLCYGQTWASSPGQYATCQLLLRGYSDQNITAGLEALNLTCITNGGPIRVGINSTYLESAAQNFTGVKVVEDLQCQAHATQFNPPLFALLYFCGNDSISFVQPTVQSLQLSPTDDNSPFFTAVLAFGESVNASISDGMFANNSAGSMLVAMQQAVVRTSNSVFTMNSGGGATSAISNDFSSIELVSSDFNESTNTVAFARDNSSLRINNCTFKYNSAAAGAVMYLSNFCTALIESSSFSSNAAVDGNGGALYTTEFAKVTAIQTIFTDNTADAGGAVYMNEQATISMRSCYFVQNKANWGGASYISGNALLKTNLCMFEGNMAIQQSAGAIYLNGTAVLHVNSTRFTNNTATVNGGAIFSANRTQADIVDSNFTNNEASEWGGGGCLMGTNWLRNCLFSGNNANNGGAVALYSNQTSTLSEIDFANNTAESKGGAIILDVRSKVTIRHGVFRNNTASWGGALYTQDRAMAVLQNCKFADNNSPSGGAGFIDHHTHVDFRQCSFVNNSAKWGGGLIFFKEAQATFEEAAFHNNSAEENGACVTLREDSQADFNNTSFTNNTASGPGACVNAEDNTRVNFTSVRFFNNTGNSGGSIRLKNQAQALVENSTMVNNSVRELGGGVVVEDTAQAEIKDCNITHNVADRGGGLAVTGNGTLHVTTSTITLNRAPAGGGVSAREHGTLILAGNTSVLANRALNGGGGGILATQTAQVFLGGALSRVGPASTFFEASADYVSIEQNNAYDFGGGLQLLDKAELHIDTYNCRIANNRANLNGGGLYASSNAFNRKQVERIVCDNAAKFDQNIAVPPVNTTLLSSPVVSNFVDLFGSDEGILSVIVKVAGFHSLPCDGVTVVAKLHLNATATDDQDSISFLGTTNTNASGIGSMLLRVRQPPDQYYVILRLPEHKEVPPAVISLHVRGCLKGEVKPDVNTCQACLPGSYSLDPNETACGSCNASATCPGGAMIIPYKGFWHSAADSPQMHRCPNAQACQGDREILKQPGYRNNSSYVGLQCTANYTGHVCGACTAGYGSSKPFNCRACMQPSVIIGLYILGFVLMLGFIKLLCHYTLAETSTATSQECSHQPAELLRCLVLYSQRLLLVAALSVEWPATVSYPMQVVAWFWSTSSAETLSIDCVLPLNAIPIAAQRVLFYLSMPVAMLVCILLIETLTFVSHKHTSHNAGRLRTHFANQLGSTAMVVVFFFFPSMLRTLFGMFACIPLDMEVKPPFAANAIGSFWVYDVAVNCFVGYHKWLAYLVGLPLVIIMCIGLPLAVVYITQSNRRQFTDPVFRKHYGFLVDSYVPHKCWWEAVVTFETVVLVAISVFGVNTGPFYQCLLMIATLAAIAALYTIFRPHACRYTGVVYMHGVYCLQLTAMVGMSFLALQGSQASTVQPHSAYGIVMGVFLILANIAYVLRLLYALFRVVDWKSMARKASVVWSRGTDCIRNHTTKIGLNKAAQHLGSMTRSHTEVFFEIEEGNSTSTMYALH